MVEKMQKKLKSYWRTCEIHMLNLALFTLQSLSDSNQICLARGSQIFLTSLPIHDRKPLVTNVPNVNSSVILKPPLKFPAVPSHTKFCRYSQFCEFIREKSNANSLRLLIAHCRDGSFLSGSNLLLLHLGRSRPPPKAGKGRQQQQGQIPGGEGAQIPGRGGRAARDAVGRGRVLAVGPGRVVARVPPALLGVDGLEAVAGRGAVLVGEAVTLER